MRSFLKIFSRFAVIFAALTLTTMPAQANPLDGLIDVEVRSGSWNQTTRYRFPVPGSQQWAEQRFIHNHRSVIRTHILPTVAEYGETGDWVADTLAVPGVRTAQNGRYQNYITRVGRYDVNVNVRIDSRRASASRNVVEMTVYMQMYGPNVNVAGESVYVRLVGVQTRPGHWSFYPRNAVRW